MTWKKRIWIAIGLMTSSVVVSAVSTIVALEFTGHSLFKKNKDNTLLSKNEIIEIFSPENVDIDDNSKTILIKSIDQNSFNNLNEKKKSLILWSKTSNDYTINYGQDFYTKLIELSQSKTENNIEKITKAQIGSTFDLNQLTNKLRFPFINVQEIILEDSISKLPEYYFCGLKKLEKINIPLSCTKIPRQLFAWDTNLKEIKIHKNISFIADQAFAGCENLSEITFDEEISKLEIDTLAFEKTSGLTKIFLPKNLNSILPTNTNFVYWWILDRKSVV